MNLFYVIGIFGITMGLLSILVVIGFTRLGNRLGTAEKGPMIPKTTIAGLGIGNLTNPQDSIARIGQNKPARMSLNALIMTPTRGLRLMSLGPAAFLMWVTWGPMSEALFGSVLMQVLVSIITFYAVMYISGYEAKYDSEGLTVPDWLFQNKHHRWEDFISIHDDGHYLYKLRFVTGRVMMQKHLVGMSTFTTFVMDVKEMNQRA